MTATAARIGFITQEFRSALAGPDSGVATKYGDLARDTKDDPVQTHFDLVADAQIFADERLTLLKRDARRMTIDISGVETGLGIDFSQAVPAATVIDDERGLNRAMLGASITIDFGKNQTNIVAWG